MASAPVAELGWSPRAPFGDYVKVSTRVNEMDAAPTFIRTDSTKGWLDDALVKSISETLQGEVGPAGYLVAYRLAEENLRIGRTVVADSVNPLNITRDAWLSVAADASKDAIEIEVICSDPSEHRRRVETRNADIDGLSLWRPPEGAASGIFRHGFYFQ